MSVEVHQTQVQKGRAKSGRTVFSIREKMYPAPHHKQNLISQTTRRRNPQIQWFQTLQTNDSCWGECPYRIRNKHKACPHLH